MQDSKLENPTTDNKYYPLNLYAKVGKRMIDLLAAFFGLLLLSPILLLVTIALSIQNNGNPFFFQKRPGRNQTPFFIAKFKTMTDEKNEDGSHNWCKLVWQLPVNKGLKHRLYV